MNGEDRYLVCWVVGFRNRVDIECRIQHIADKHSATCEGCQAHSVGNCKQTGPRHDFRVWGLGFRAWGMMWGLTILGVPYWGPYCKGILTFACQD